MVWIIYDVFALFKTPPMQEIGEKRIFPAIIYNFSSEMMPVAWIQNKLK